MKLYSEYNRHLVAVDCIIFGYDIYEKELKLLLVRRNFEPEKYKWSLAGGFVREEECLDEASVRILSDLTGLTDIYPEQSYTFGEVNRDPGARVISVAYFALIRISDIKRELTEQTGACWCAIGDLPELIFDHSSMVKKALLGLQENIKVKPVGFELLPEKFTLAQLQELYEAIYRRKTDKRNFRKKILRMGILEKLDEKETQTSKKGAFYYRYNKDKYENLKLDGFYFNFGVK
jgi:8-oxo-dGTP diphosphatase